MQGRDAGADFVAVIIAITKAETVDVHVAVAQLP